MAAEERHPIVVLWLPNHGACAKIRLVKSKRGICGFTVTPYRVMA
jgi:hypothetical protein